ANIHLWDAEELYGPLWDAASAACVPAVKRLLDEKVDPNSKDEEGLTILSSISDLFFDCDFDEINWSEALAEEKQTLELLRSHGAKMTKELT
ncbi:MAG: ankyrin repeat domain-containing protein, partial [Acinetobacter sp.]